MAAKNWENIDTIIHYNCEGSPLSLQESKDGLVYLLIWLITFVVLMIKCMNVLKDVENLG